MSDAERSGSGKATIPLFPLQTVLLPGAPLPLHLFEPRYRQLAADLRTGVVPDRRFGVVAIKAGAAREVDLVEHVYEIGCTALLEDSERLPDGRFDILTKGERRFRLLDIDATRAPYLVGTVEWVEDDRPPPGAAEATARLAGAARAAYRRYSESAWDRSTWAPPAPDTHPVDLAYLLAADCLLSLPDRQALLEQTHPLRRLSMVCRLLSQEAGFLSALHAVPAPPAQLPHLTTRAGLN